MAPAAAFLLCACACASAQNVNVSSPVPGTTVSDPFSLSASCNVAGADAMQVYLDSTLVYSAEAPSMNAYINASTGTHKLEVKCWVDTTAYSSGTFSFTAAQEAGTAQVPVASPFVNATVGSPFSVIAGCNVPNANDIQVYLDSALVYSGNPASMNYSLSAAPGVHKLNIKCWAKGTQYATGDYNITVAPQTAANPVVVTSPLANSTVGTPFSAIASCNVPGGADAMQAYLDSYLVYAQNVTSLNANITAGIGEHLLTVKCWKKGVEYTTGDYPFSVGPEAGTSQVVVSSPLPGTTEPSAFNVTANCNVAGATAMQVYLDSALVYSPPVTAINYLATASSAPHTLEVKCLAGGSTYTSGVFPINPADTSGSGFGGSSNIPVPPSYAHYANNVQNYGDWTSETGPAANCAHGVPSPTCNPPDANYNPNVVQVPDPQPLAGSSKVAGEFQLFNGPIWNNAVWINNLYTNTSLTNYIWDLYVYVDSTNYNGSELDLYTTANGGLRFMIGSFCNRAGNSFDTWDSNPPAGQKSWVHNKQIPCATLWTPNGWHHITFYNTVDFASSTYEYHTIRFDGVDYVLNQTQSAGGSGWPDGNVGIQVQLDTNASGLGVNQYIENIQVYSW
jgi:hypothetical protein